MAVFCGFRGLTFDKKELRLIFEDFFIKWSKQNE